jgi:hypothetical protein
MDTPINAAIEVIVKRITTNTDLKSEDALRLSQAAVNLGHLIGLLKQYEVKP